MVAHTGFEPVISALRGQRPKPLDECATTNVKHYINAPSKQQFSVVSDAGREIRLHDARHTHALITPQTNNSL